MGRRSWKGMLGMKNNLIRNRLFFFWNYDREEEWLNRMSEDGYELEDVFLWRYRFRRGDGQKMRYKLEFLSHDPRDEKGRDYLDFLADAGIETVCTFGRWAYLRRPAEDGDFELYSDISSKIGYFKRLFCFLLPVALVNLVLGLINILAFAGWDNRLSGGLCLFVFLLFCWGMRRTAGAIWRLNKEKKINE